VALQLHQGLVPGAPDFAPRGGLLGGVALQALVAQRRMDGLVGRDGGQGAVVAGAMAGAVAGAVAAAAMSPGTAAVAVLAWRPR